MKKIGKHSVKNGGRRDFDGTFWISGLWMKRFFSVKRRRFAIFDGSKTKYIDGKSVKMKPGMKKIRKYSVKNVGWRTFDGTFLILVI